MHIKAHFVPANSRFINNNKYLAVLGTLLGP